MPAYGSQRLLVVVHVNQLGTTGKRVTANLGGATGSEIVTLCETVRKDVFDKFGIDIHPEVNII